MQEHCFAADKTVSVIRFIQNKIIYLLGDLGDLKKFTKPEGKEELEGASGLYLAYWTSHIHSSIVHKPLAIHEYVLTVWELTNTKENRGIHGTQHFWAS